MMPWTSRRFCALTAILLAPFSLEGSEVVNDITQLNPIEVDGVVAPTSVDEIRAAVLGARIVSIGGGRNSQGGQTATDHAVQIDMRRFNRILSLDPARRLITVQAGITWREIQEAIDPYGLSVTIMQTYANFTVGGSLSVNCHGRYVNAGPIISTVQGIRMVLADGTVVSASPKERADLFYAAIGGYGGIGVIAEATLLLADNVRIERSSTVMPVSGYRRFFLENIRNSPDALFHNADLYPPRYSMVRAVTWSRTVKPVTVEERLTGTHGSYRLDRGLLWMITELPFGKWLRQYVIDPIRYVKRPVVWRNHEASYDTAELEPVSRTRTTYVLQEYFVPVGKFDEFPPRMAAILNRHHVNVVNVSIRHSPADPGSLLAWARSDVFAFVLYYKQGTSAADRAEVARWTRELIGEAVALGGAYYLPYQIHATRGQFLAAYPRFPEFLAEKNRVDPSYKFRNRLWDAYDPKDIGETTTVPHEEHPPIGP